MWKYCDEARDGDYVMAPVHALKDDQIWWWSLKRLSTKQRTKTKLSNTTVGGGRGWSGGWFSTKITCTCSEWSHVLVTSQQWPCMCWIVSDKALIELVEGRKRLNDSTKGDKVVRCCYRAELRLNKGEYMVKSTSEVVAGGFNGRKAHNSLA